MTVHRRTIQQLFEHPSSPCWRHHGPHACPFCMGLYLADGHACNSYQEVRYFSRLTLTACALLQAEGADGLPVQHLCPVRGGSAQQRAAGIQVDFPPCAPICLLIPSSQVKTRPWPSPLAYPRAKRQSVSITPARPTADMASQQLTKVGMEQGG